MKIHIFWGDLTDISAKKEALVTMQMQVRKDTSTRVYRQPHRTLACAQARARSDDAVGSCEHVESHNCYAFVTRSVRSHIHIP